MHAPPRSQHTATSMVQSEPQTAWPSHCSPGSMMPLPHWFANVVVVVEVVVVVDVVAHPPAVQASQTLGKLPMHAVLSPGAVQLDPSRFSFARVSPRRSVWQQTTAPGLPQVERDAQRATTFLQSLFVRAARAACFAQRT